jgi:hypothetical protein
VAIEQYRIDANNDFKLINTAMSKAANPPQGNLSTRCRRMRAGPGTDDPNSKGAEQGFDLLVVTGASSTASAP